MFGVMKFSVPAVVVYAAIVIGFAQSFVFMVWMSASLYGGFRRTTARRRTKVQDDRQVEATHPQETTPAGGQASVRTVTGHSVPSEDAIVTTREEFLAANFASEAEVKAFLSDVENRRLLDTLPPRTIQKAESPSIPAPAVPIAAPARVKVRGKKEKTKRDTLVHGQMWQCACGEQVPSENWSKHVGTHKGDGKGAHRRMTVKEALNAQIAST
jgi:hypothetical protein